MCVCTRVRVLGNVLLVVCSPSCTNHYYPLCSQFLFTNPSAQRSQCLSRLSSLWGPLSSLGLPRCPLSVIWIGRFWDICESAFYMMPGMLLVMMSEFFTAENASTRSEKFWWWLWLLVTPYLNKCQRGDQQQVRVKQASASPVQGPAPRGGASREKPRCNVVH